MIDWTLPLEVQPPEALEGEPENSAQAAELASPEHPAVLEQGGNPDQRGRYWVIVAGDDPAPFYPDGRAMLAPIKLRNVSPV